MVNIIENWAEISGTIKNIVNNPDLEGYLQLQIMLEKTKDIEPYPNLARADEGEVIRVNISRVVAESAKPTPGAVFKATVRKAAGQIYFAK